MTDIVARLRDQQTKHMTPIMGQAADEIDRLRNALRWIGDRANTQLLSEQLDAPRRDHVEMAYDMNACARAALAKTNTTF